MLKEEYYNETADIWSIGVLTYTLLTGSKLFGNDRDDKIRDNVIRGRHTYSRNYNYLSKSARKFIMTCL